MSFDLLVVCYKHDRDEIRSRLIGWLQNQDTSLKGVEGYKNLLKSYFDLVDENKNGKLDATEFREFVVANQYLSAKPSQTYIIKGSTSSAD